MESLQGKFLISETELEDPNFTQSVVLLLEHNSEGAFGLIVNQMSTLRLGGVLDEFKGTEAAELPLFVGGPVQQEFLFCLYSSIPELDNDAVIEVIPGVVFNPDLRSVLSYLKDIYPGLHPEQRPDIHFYAGYSGWGEGQLEKEMSVYGSWVVLPANQALIFSKDPEESWRSALKRKGGIYYIAAEMGFKPSMN